MTPDEQRRKVERERARRRRQSPEYREREQARQRARRRASRPAGQQVPPTDYRPHHHTTVFGESEYVRAVVESCPECGCEGVYDIAGAGEWVCPMCPWWWTGWQKRRAA